MKVSPIHVGVFFNSHATHSLNDQYRKVCTLLSVKYIHNPTEKYPHTLNLSLEEVWLDHVYVHKYLIKSDVGDLLLEEVWLTDHTTKLRNYVS